jgi:hypothetical protein
MADPFELDRTSGDFPLDAMGGETEGDTSGDLLSKRGAASSSSSS